MEALSPFQARQKNCNKDSELAPPPRGKSITLMKMFSILLFKFLLTQGFREHHNQSRNDFIQQAKCLTDKKYQYKSNPKGKNRTEWNEEEYWAIVNSDPFLKH